MPTSAAAAQRSSAHLPLPTAAPALPSPTHLLPPSCAGQADAIVVNTCGFVEDAKDESIEVGAWRLRRRSGLAGPGCALPRCALLLPHPRPLAATDLPHLTTLPSPSQTIIEAARMKSEGKVRKVVVTGCLAQRYSEELAAQLPEADLVIG